MAEMGEIEQKDIDKQWPGFEVKCKECGSTMVLLENTLGFSETSGSWGEITLRCLECGESVDIVDA